MTVRTYWAWETTTTLRLLGGARGAGAPTGGKEMGGAYCVATRTLIWFPRPAGRGPSTIFTHVKTFFTENRQTKHVISNEIASLWH